MWHYTNKLVLNILCTLITGWNQKDCISNIVNFIWKMSDETETINFCFAIKWLIRNAHNLVQFYGLFLSSWFCILENKLLLLISYENTFFKEKSYIKKMKMLWFMSLKKVRGTTRCLVDYRPVIKNVSDIIELLVDAPL